MKHLATLAVVLLLSSSAVAQFRSDVARQREESEARNTLAAMTEDDGFFARLFNPQNWSMRQSYSMSYSTNGSQSVSLSQFTNTFLFRPNADMIFSADVSAVYSPYSTFGDAFSKQINGIYLSSARFDWKLGEETFLMIRYDGGPVNAWQDRYANPFYEFHNPARGSALQFEGGYNSAGWRSTEVTLTH